MFAPQHKPLIFRIELPWLFDCEREYITYLREIL